MSDFDPDAFVSGGGGFDPDAFVSATRNASVMRDGVEIPLPTAKESAAFEAWAKRNGVNEPFHPGHHYDNVGAFRAGIDRDKGSAHFPDTFKLPGHPTFSNESKYATGEFAKHAGYWPEGAKSDADFVAPKERYSPPLAPGESQDQGPPTEPGMKLAPDAAYEKQYRRDLLKRISERNERTAKNAILGVGQGGLSDFADEAAGAVGAVVQPLANKLGYPEQTMGEAYREGRDHARLEHARAKEEDPWAYGLGKVAGGIGQIGALGAGGVPVALRGGKAVAQGAALGGVSGLGGSNADLTKGEVGGAALDTGIGASLGAAASWLIPKATDTAAAYLKNPLNQLKEKLGLGMQLPQKAYEGAAEQVGKLPIAQKSSGASDVSGPLASANVKALRQVRDNADFGSELASSLRSASEELGGTGNKLVSAMSPEERGQVAKSMAELLHTRGLGNVTPEFVANNMDDLARSAGLDLQNLTGNAFLRMANKRDPQWWVSAGEGVRKFWGNKLLAGETIDPRLAQQYGLNRDVAESMQSGAVDRMGRPMSEGGAPGVYQNSIASIHGKLAGPEDKLAVELARAASQGKASIDPSGWSVDPKQFGDQIAAIPAATKAAAVERFAPTRLGNETPVLDMEAEARGLIRKGLKQMPAPGDPEQAAQLASVDNMYGRARDLIDTSNTIGARAKSDRDAEFRMLFDRANEFKPGFDEAAKQEAMKTAALRRLQNVATGRNFLEQRALPLAGAIAGGAGAPAGMGVLGMLTGAPIGAGAASKLPMIGDALGEIGQGLATGGRDAIKQSALRAAGDPQKIQSLAQVPGAVGDAARRALQVAKDPAAFAARSYMLSLMPEFRQMLAGDEQHATGR